MGKNIFGCSQLHKCVSAVAVLRPAASGTDGHLASVSSDGPDDGGAGPAAGTAGASGQAASSPAQEEPSTSGTQQQLQQDKPQGKWYKDLFF